MFEKLEDFCKRHDLRTGRLYDPRNEVWSLIIRDTEKNIRLNVKGNDLDVSYFVYDLTTGKRNWLTEDDIIKRLFKCIT